MLDNSLQLFQITYSTLPTLHCGLRVFPTNEHGPITGAGCHGDEETAN